MKKNIRKILALLGALAVLLGGCGSAGNAGQAGSETNEKPGAGAKKIAVLLGGVKDDYGYNYRCYQLGEELKEKLGVEVITKESVADTSDAEGIIEELINQGCKIVIATQFGFLDAAMNVAKRHADVAFYYLGNTDQAHDNFSVSVGQQWDPWYLCGMLAGMNSKTGKLGFVASMPVPDVMIAINSFELGAQSMNSDAETNVVFTGSWDDSGLATTSATQLITSGCDVISQFQDTPKPIIDLCAKENIPVFGCNADARELAPQVWLSAMCADWDGLIEEIGRTIDGQYECVTMQGSFDTKLSKIAETGDLVTDDMLGTINDMKQKMETHEFSVFEGPIYNQAGEVMFEKGEIPEAAEINKIDWFVEGVNGNAN